MSGAVRKPDGCKHFHGALVAYFLRYFFKNQRERHVFERRERRQQVVRLENKADKPLSEIRELLFAEPLNVVVFYYDVALTRLFKSGDHV